MVHIDLALWVLCSPIERVCGVASVFTPHSSRCTVIEFVVFECHVRCRMFQSLHTESSEVQRAKIACDATILVIQNDISAATYLVTKACLAILRMLQSAS